MSDLDPTTIAHQQLRAAGISEDQIASVLERAAALVQGLAVLAELDDQLPEPALTWQPIASVSP